MARRIGGWLAEFPDEGPDGGARYRIDEFGKLSFVVPIGAPIRSKQLCLVALTEWSDESQTTFVEFIAIATAGPRVSSYDRRVSLSHFFGFEKVEVDELRRVLPSRALAHFRTGAIPPAAFSATVAALIARRPDVGPAVQRLEQLLMPMPAAPSHSEEIVAQERDSVAMALELSGVRPRGLPKAIDLSTDVPYLTGLNQAVIREDPAIQHDASVFGDWDLLARHQVGTVVFERGRERVTIINVNRHPIEHSLGVDLVYYTHRFDAFVLVQYKSLRSEGSEWVYRPDEQLKEELARMRAVPVEVWSGQPDDYRLTAEACYMKICRSVLAAPFSEGLIPGWYLPVSYWEALCASDRVKGPRGGIVVTANTIGRYLNNSQFIEMVSRGWLGSRGDSSRWVEDVIRVGLEEGRSIVLAAHVRD